MNAPAPTVAVPVGFAATGRLALTVLVVTSALGAAAHGQSGPLVLRDATVLTGTGATLERGTVIIRAGQIAEVGTALELPSPCRPLDLQGKVVTPGFIDVLGLTTLRAAFISRVAVARAADAFDRYASDELETAWRQGVTTVYLPAGVRDGVGGLGSVIRLRGPDADDWVLAPEAGLHFAVSPGAGVVSRVRTARQLAELLQGARDYRSAWDAYQESLKEYEEKIAERAKKAEEEEKKKEEKSKQGDDEKKRSKADTPQNEKPAEQKKEEKKDELKKPEPPGKDRNTETWLRVLDGELRLRVEAHEPADILNVLDIARRFEVAIVLEGGTGAHLVAKELAEAEVPVVLTTPPPRVAYTPGPDRLARADAVSILRDAGVRVYLASGLGADGTAPALALQAAYAVGHGADEALALEALTAGAARLLGVGDRLGRVESGYAADLIVWSDHPFAPGARVERVFVNGKEVYAAGQDN